MKMNNGVTLLHDGLTVSANRFADKVAIVCGEERLSYASLEARSNAFAHALRRRGVKRGDRVVVFADNATETAIAFWGVLKANAVVSPISPHTRPDKLAYLLKDCRARALVSQAHLAPTFGSVAPGSTLEAVFVTGELDRHAYSHVPGLTRWVDALEAEETGAPPRRECIDIDLASIIYTSGSTGDAKGVMLTHRNMVAAASSIMTYLENTADDVILGVLPLSFDYGLYQMIMAIHAGARLVLEKGFVYPVEVLSTAVRESVTGFPGVPTLFSMLGEMKNPGTWDLSKVRYVTTTAAALMPKHVATLKARFPAARIYSMYGLTECKRCTYLPPADLDRKPWSVGVPIPNTEAWIVDEAGARVGPNVVGELVIRGATVMAGYWEKPEETAKKLRQGPLPGEHVLHTGDLCRMDEEGYVSFVARVDDVIKSRGEKVAPKEVELALLGLPGVKDAAVIGIPDELLGQAPKAFVIAEEGVTLSAGELRRLCLARVEPFMVPKVFEFVTSLPRSDNGKVDKLALARRHAAPGEA